MESVRPDFFRCSLGFFPSIPRVLVYFFQENLANLTWAMKKTLVGWVIREIILPSYIGIIINHYKDPYYPTSVMESSKGFFRCSHAWWFGDPRTLQKTPSVTHLYWIIIVNCDINWNHHWYRIHLPIGKELFLRRLEHGKGGKWSRENGGNGWAR